MTCHPEMVSLRKLRTLRESTRLFGSDPSDEQIAWAALDYDIISVEGTDYPKTFLTTVTKWKLTRKLFRAKTLADARRKVRSAYRKLTGKADFRFE